MNSRLQHLFLFLFALLFTSVLAAPEAIPEALAAPEAFPEALAEPEALPEPIPQGSGAGGNPEGRPDTPRQPFHNGDHRPGECRILGRHQSCYRRPYVNSMRVQWVQGRVKFDCWYWNGSEYWDRTSSGCWVQERYIESGCWHDLRRCRNA